MIMHILHSADFAALRNISRILGPLKDIRTQRKIINDEKQEIILSVIRSFLLIDETDNQTSSPEVHLSYYSCQPSQFLMIF